MRALRFAMEYAKAERVLRKACICSTVVVFGSARTLPPEDAERQLISARTPEEKIAALQQQRSSAYYEKARAFAQIVSLRGGALRASEGCGENVIATGGGPGIMEAANRGASDVGAPSVGFNITLPAEQQPNAYSTPELTFRFHYFAMRKMHLAMRANALAVFPGGFGTLDELFEILTLLQTRKAPPLPVVLFGREYWTTIINFGALLAEGAISPGDKKLFHFADEPEEAWEILSREGLNAHLPSEAMRSTARGQSNCDAKIHAEDNHTIVGSSANALPSTVETVR
ncbi:MAG: LOG family protein [Reyranella sp.]|nr:LOG family protein [Reyranella sp.]